MNFTTSQRRFAIGILITLLAWMGVTLSPEVRRELSRLILDAPLFADQKKSGTTLVHVTRVVDGDTFELEGGERVRLIGVNAPESVKPNSPVECFGKEASAFLKALLTDREVRLERDVSERDRYGRLLRYAYLGELFVNEYIVREGYATAASFPPDVARQDTLRAAELQARAEQKGLWDEHRCPQDRRN